eukprot:TRINITY_DN223_c2_g1_i1.p1 TRINITY_DN223_c2_g1~~TRINITY_DN223_c2_g1_i1.p1  ORF type:complete len:494 (+),score=49.68 TRINITY_DN223_c2_g1_i1:44-1525(+)
MSDITGKTYLRNLYVLGFSFLFVFTSFNAIQNLEASIVSSGHCGGCDWVCRDGNCDKEAEAETKDKMTCEFVDGNVRYCSAFGGKCGSSCDDVAIKGKSDTAFVECAATNNIGSIAIGLIYGAYTCSCLAGVFIVDRLGERKCFQIAFAIFALFSASNVAVANNPTDITLQWWLLLPSSALVGVAASFLWIAQGTYLTTNAELHASVMGHQKGSSLGLFTGIFFAFQQSTQIAGNILATVFLGYALWSPARLMFLYLVLTVAGLMLSLRISNVSEDSTSRATTSLSESIMITVKMWSDPKFNLLMPLILYVGLEQAFIWGIFNQFVRQMLGISEIGFLMSGFGATNVVGSILFGRLSDAVGRLSILLLGGACHLLVIHQLFLIDTSTCQPTHRLFLLALACLWGVGDSVFNTQLFALVGDTFSDRKEAGFSNLKLWQSAATSGLLLLSSDTRISKTFILQLLCVFLFSGFAAYTKHRNHMHSKSQCDAFCTSG